MRGGTIATNDFHVEIPNKSWYFWHPCTFGRSFVQNSQFECDKLQSVHRFPDCQLAQCNTFRSVDVGNYFEVEQAMGSVKIKHKLISFGQIEDMSCLSCVYFQIA